MGRSKHLLSPSNKLSTTSSMWETILLLELWRTNSKNTNRRKRVTLLKDSPKQWPKGCSYKKWTSSRRPSSSSIWATRGSYNVAWKNSKIVSILVIFLHLSSSSLLISTRLNICCTFEFNPGTSKRLSNYTQELIMRSTQLTAKVSNPNNYWKKLM